MSSKISEIKKLSSGAVIVALLTAIIGHVIILFVGKYLWNKTLVKYVTFVKPLESVLDLFAIAIIIKILLV